MQRIFSKKSPIGPVPALAAALLAAGALSVSVPAFAAPIGDAPALPSAVPSATSFPEIILIQGRSGKGNRGGGNGRGDSHVFKQGGDRWDGNDWRRVERGHDDRDSVEGRHDDHDRVEGRHDHGNHYGWQRGMHYGWDKNARNRDFDDRRYGDGSNWRAERQQSRWTGQDIGRVNSSIFQDYDAYDLPRPGRGQYYARSGNDVYLVTKQTRRIVDAFMLRDLVR
jgi:Ni/Co efflux regulator RcnB